MASGLWRFARRDEHAKVHQQAQVDLERTDAQLELASAASKNALKARDNYVLNMKKRTSEAMQLISAAKQAKRAFALLMLNVDRFRDINEVLGYAQGDLSFRCNVDYRGQVTNLRIGRNDGYRG